MKQIDVTSIKLSNVAGLPEKGDVFLDDKRRGACFYKFSCHPLIALRELPKTPQQIGTLAHEAIHAVYHIIFDKIEEQSRSEEIVAHSVGAVVRTVLTQSLKE